MGVDDLATQGAKASATTLSDHFGPRTFKGKKAELN